MGMPVTTEVVAALHAHAKRRCEFELPTNLPALSVEDHAGGDIHLDVDVKSA